MLRRLGSILAGAALVGGCAAGASDVERPAAPHRESRPATAASATRPSTKADLALDQIKPMPVLPTTRPAWASGHAPIDALMLFARARDAMKSGERFTAINLLEQAAKIDPNSYDVRYALGQAYTAAGAGSTDKALAAFESAARIEPDHLQVQSELGKRYLVGQDLNRALDHLLLAIQTTDYQSDEEPAAVVDFYLGKALEESGYDRAALDCYQKLIAELQSGALNLRGNPEVSYLIQQPEALFVTTANLLEKRGRHEEAIALYQQAVDRQPGEFIYQAQLVRGLLRAGKQKEAMQRATQVVRLFRASPDSLSLLKDTFSNAGGENALAAELRRMQAQNPADHALLYALVDVLTSQGNGAEATKLLTDAARDARYETDLVRRLFKIYNDSDQVDDAARLLIEALAADPENTRDITPMWQALLRPWRKHHLTIMSLQALSVPPSALASKQFWIAQMAQIWNREQLRRSSLEQAVKQNPPFAPAYRSLINQYWSRDDWSSARKREASEKLIATVQQSGGAALAAELRGVMLFDARDLTGATRAFALARKLGGNGPDLRLTQAAALQASGDITQARQVLWKLAHDQPTVEESYLHLFRGYLENRQADQAIKVLQAWLASDPGSINAQVLESTVFFQGGNVEAAEKTLNALFEREPDNADVLGAMAAFYKQTNRNDDFINKLEAQRKLHPENRAAVEQLVLLYADQKRMPEAVRVLDGSRAAAKEDPDLLYYLAGLYSRIGQKETTEQVLEEVVRIDPKHAPACNDLGYDWAEQGKNLTRAESLIRTALRLEPDNGSFLDSLGWVLYKQGKFIEAKAALQRAIGASSFPDPVVLDHLGDTLYRLDEKSQAMHQWKQSQERLARVLGNGDEQERDDLKELRLQLQQKLKQSATSQPASVAPTGTAPNRQAINN
jgi:tetratricopeptide (TPR) repeat protein